MKRLALDLLVCVLALAVLFGLGALVAGGASMDAQVRPGFGARP